jgi:hypothetical protein
MKTVDERSIYHMSLHEKLVVDDNWIVMRVPGGWIYNVMYAGVESVSSVFVPWSDPKPHFES